MNDIVAEAKERRLVLARELWRQGLTFREIGAQLGISRQRAQQLVKPDEASKRAAKAARRQQEGAQ